jgi:large subunit ribosomal protein L22
MAIRGRPVEEAAALLRFMPQHAARDIERVLKSATANAENNHNLSAEDLVVVDAVANEGPTIKRWRPRAQGRAFPIHKPMTHITIVVADREA